MTAQIQVINFAAFYGPGAHTKQSDKVWGNAVINNTLVSFWGKRNGRLSFKTRAGEAGKRDAEAKWAEKIGGRRDGGDVYTVVKDKTIQMILAPTLETDLRAHFYSKLARGQVKRG